MDQQNQLGNASLALGIASASLVFGIGFCSLLGAQGGWLPLAGVPLLACGAASAFLGVSGVFLGAAGLFGKRSKGTAVTGMVLGLVGMCLFFFFLAAVGG